MDTHVPGTAIAHRASIRELARQRDDVLRLFAEAYEAEAVARAKERAAYARLKEATSHGEGRYTYHLSDHKLELMDIRERDLFDTMSRRITDTRFWGEIIAMTDLERLMDKSAKDEMLAQILKDPPEATEANIIATLEQMRMDAGLIFRRGIATCFSGLDRRFRSHDGWQFGSRVILNNAIDDSGGWTYYAAKNNVLQDIERVFLTLDKVEPPPGWAGIVALVEKIQTGRPWRRTAGTAENDYFRIHVYLNGNVHIWFKRDDLLRKVNILLGEYYGSPIPEERGPDEDTGLHDAKTTPARNYGFFPSPDGVAERVLDFASIYRRKDDPPLRVLEPSAGTGQLARRAVQLGGAVDCVELQPALAQDLLREGIYRRVSIADFLSLPPEPVYDRVIMNPPFDRERDIDHVMHALKFLAPGGMLVAVMSAGTEFRMTKKSKAFRDLVINKMRGEIRDLPAGSFSSVGTYVNTLMLRVRAPGA